MMFKWYELLHYKEILAIYWMTLVNIINEGQEVSPSPAGDHKAALNRREGTTNTRHK